MRVRYGMDEWWVPDLELTDAAEYDGVVYEMPDALYERWKAASDEFDAACEAVEAWHTAQSDTVEASS